MTKERTANASKKHHTDEQKKRSVFYKFHTGSCNATRNEIRLYNAKYLPKRTYCISMTKNVLHHNDKRTYCITMTKNVLHHNDKRTYCITMTKELLHHNDKRTYCITMTKERTTSQ